ncbi:MAG: cupin domain-containing protein [Chloroflexi bacterium]|nr:cupin domain-containing protein [Chloroflexota bacterium]
MYVRHEADVPSIEMVSGVHRKLLGSRGRLMLVQFEIQKGTAVPEHQHESEQAGYVLEGRFEVIIGGERRILGPGHSYLIPSNVTHSGFVHEDAKFLDIYSPPRAEYLG